MIWNYLVRRLSWSSPVLDFPSLTTELVSKGVLSGDISILLERFKIIWVVLIFGDDFQTIIRYIRDQIIPVVIKRITMRIMPTALKLLLKFPFRSYTEVSFRVFHNKYFLVCFI